MMDAYELDELPPEANGWSYPVDEYGEWPKLN